MPRLPIVKPLTREFKSLGIFLTLGDPYEICLGYDCEGCHAARIIGSVPVHSDGCLELYVRGNEAEIVQLGI